LLRLGPGRRDARPRRPPVPARSQHRAGHDRSFAGTARRARRGHRVRAVVLAGARNLVPRHRRRRGPGGGAMNGLWLPRVLAWGIAVTLVALPIVGVLNGWFAADRWPVRQLA